ncbi:hypothetical protein NECAME_14676 [Necator americanus]|uniref:Uncharacterized protein n=1 Tax=Necator americanus TaxID=51031 RepID=W2SLQ9_NECAM|nr:hypothetical protein NECAME_14676 [Necator americanus]ETN70560.1 hypothetical protein NECAME_14676 [Necator americanus]
MLRTLFVAGFAIQRRKMGGINWKDFCGGDLWHNPFPDGLPNLSVCFQHTVLVWVPVGFFWALFPFLVAQASLTSRKYSSLPWSPHLLLKIVVFLFMKLTSTVYNVKFDFKGLYNHRSRNTKEIWYGHVRNTPFVSCCFRHLRRTTVLSKC